MKKSLQRREYADQVHLFEALAGSHVSLSSGTSDQLAVQVLNPSVKFFATSVASILSDLFGEIKGTIPRAIERPFLVPENATVFELTSLIVNVLKRLAEYGPVLESILTQQQTGNWDGSMQDIVVDCDLENSQRFFSDLLGALETSLDAKSKTLRKPMQTLLFQLNNYNYICKNLKLSTGILLGVLITDSIVKRYEQIIEALLRSFTNRYNSAKKFVVVLILFSF